MKNGLRLSSVIRIFQLISILCISLLSGCSNGSNMVSIITDNNPGDPVLHGIGKFKEALDAKKIRYELVEQGGNAKGSTVIIAGLADGKGLVSELIKDNPSGKPEVPEALSVFKTEWQEKPAWVISGYDDRGLMYGLLDFAERTGWGNRKDPFDYVEETSEKPDLETRAVSMYTMNRAYWESRFYDDSYWEKYLDMLSENRFNSFVIIFGYENGGFLAPPYPYFFNVDEFPGVYMAGLSAGEQERNLKAMNHLIEMAHMRGIKLSVAIWDHIYRGGVQSGGMAGLDKPPTEPVNNLVWGVNSDNLIPYTKAALTRLVQLMPELDGIEFRMHNESGLRRNEQETFWTDVFHSLKSAAPEMKFVLRAKDMPESVIQAALDEGIDFRIETKYWMEQMGMPFHPTHINLENQQDRRHGYADMLRYPQEYSMYWRLWTGGTVRILLWGSPGYVRRFTESAKLYNGDTYEVNEPLATKMESMPHDMKPFDLLNPQNRYYDYEFERYWYFFQLFGRIGYNPEQSPIIWQKEYELRFGDKTGKVIEEAIEEASWILPRIVASCYPYGCFPTTRGWAEKQRLGDLNEYALSEGSDIQQFANFDEEALILIEGGETAKTLPSATSLWFERTSHRIDSLIALAEDLAGKNRNKEFISAVTDLKILSALALYHSRRIPAAVSYRIFDRTKDISALDKAIGYERNAIEAWKMIVESAGDVYNENLMMGISEARFGVLTHRLTGHWKDELAYLEEGLSELEQERLKYTEENSPVTAPEYKAARYPDNGKLFGVDLQRITSAPSGKPLAIKAKVSSSSGIKWVRLRYRSVNQRLDYSTMEMTDSGENDLYQAMIPAEEIDPLYDLMYFIEVMDNNGNGKIFPDFNVETPYVIVKTGS